MSMHPRSLDAQARPLAETLEPRLLLAGDFLVTVDTLFTNDATPALTGTIEDTDADVDVTVDGVQYAAVNQGDGTWTLADNTLAALDDGTYDVDVQAVDTVEGTSATDDTTDELTVDTSEPVVTIDALRTADTTPRITGTVTDADDQTEILVTVEGVQYSALNNGDGTWTLADDTVDALAEGTYDVSVTATDRAGNTGSDDTSDELVVDLTDPVVTIDPLNTADTTPTLTGTIDEDDDNVEILVTVNGVEYTATNNGNGTWSADVTTALAPATYDVSATATDSAGNTGTDGSANELVVDVLTGVSVDALVTNDPTPALTGTVSGVVDTITVTIDGVEYAAIDNGDRTWTLADDTIADPLADGTYDVSVTATNGMGGTFEDQTTDELTIDTVAPAVTVDATETSDTTPALTGTIDDPDAEVVLTVDGEQYEATNNGDGTWSISASTISEDLELGTYDVVATAMDPAGNEVTDATTDELVILDSVNITLGTVRWVRFVDPDGTTVFVNIMNGASRGSVRVSLTSTTEMTTQWTRYPWRVVTSETGVTLDGLRVFSETRGIRIAAWGGDDRGTTLGGVQGNTTLGGLWAMGVDLIGDGIEMSNGLIRSLRLRSIQADVTMGRAAGRLLRGLFVYVREAVEDADITITNNDVRSFVAGSMINSSLMVSVDTPQDADEDGVNDLPAVGDIADEPWIGMFRIMGYRGAEGDLFVNSNVAAGSLGLVMLRDAQLDNGDTAFGLAGSSARRIMLFQNRRPFFYRDGVWTNGLDTDDLTVNLA
jgi:hypothetical protein